MNKNIYIAGKITGLENYKEVFEAAEIDLKERGFVPMNPARLSGGFEHGEYMHICFSMIDVCDTVYLISNWQESKGAVMEFEYARENHKDIIREELKMTNAERAALTFQAIEDKKKADKAIINKEAIKIAKQKEKQINEYAITSVFKMRGR